MENFIYLIPSITILAGAFTLMFMSMYERFTTSNFIFVSALFLIVALGFSLTSFSELYSVKPFNDIFNNALVFDTFGNFFEVLLISGALLLILIGEKYTQKDKCYKGEFFSVMLFSVFGMVLLAHSNELISAYISLEIASFSIYILVGFNNENNKRVEAIFKYLVLGSFVGAFYLLGVVLIYGATGSTNLNVIGEFINAGQNLDLVYIGITLLLFVFLFKIAAVPFHSWAIDVYRGSPVIVTAFMASTFKIAIFSLFLRAFIHDFYALQDFWDTILYVLTVLTLVIGTFLALSQTIVKKMLAASSIVHTGYLLLAFISIGKNPAGDINLESAHAIMFYLNAYLLTSIGAFGLVSHIIAQTSVKVTYDDFKGLAKQRPVLAASMTIFLFSLAGIPSTIGFIAKFYVFTEAINAGYVLLATLAIVATIVSVFYYFKLVAMMYFYAPVDKACDLEVIDDKRISTYVIVFLSAMIIWGGVGSAIVFLIPVPNIDAIIDISKMAIDSLHLK